MQPIYQVFRTVQLLGRLIDVELSIRGILRGFGLDRNFGTSSKIL